MRGLTIDAGQGAEYQKYTVVLVYMMVALSSTVLTGWAGQLSLGQFAFVGVGAYATGYYGQDEMEAMRDKEVAGDICMQFFNAAGETAPYKSDNNVIGIEIKKLRKVPHSIGVAGGVEKVSAIRGAINGRYINTLITDAECAKKLAENN